MTWIDRAPVVSHPEVEESYRILRSRVDLGDSGRLADVAERNLRRLQGLIDEAVGEGSTP